MPDENVRPETNITPETIDRVKEVGIEASPVAEVVPSSLVVPQVPNDDAQVVPSVATDEPVVPITIPKDEVNDIASDDVGKADVNWVGKVQDVIRDDQGQPYKEDDDAEHLNEAYMKERFNVDVDGPIEEK